MLPPLLGCDENKTEIEISSTAEIETMSEADAQAIWNAYYERIRRRRLSEAEQLLAAAKNDGWDDETPFYLDYCHFSPAEENILALQSRLAEDYDVSVKQYGDDSYWRIDATTRPRTMAATEEELLEWVDYMAEVSASYACVFSSWTLSDANTGQQWSSEEHESKTD